MFQHEVHRVLGDRIRGQHQGQAPFLAIDAIGREYRDRDRERHSGAEGRHENHHTVEHREVDPMDRERDRAIDRIGIALDHLFGDLDECDRCDTSDREQHDGSECQARETKSASSATNPSLCPARS